MKRFRIFPLLLLVNFFVWSALVSSYALFLPAIVFAQSCSPGPSNIDCNEPNHWAWNDVIGWVDFLSLAVPIVRLDTTAGKMTGYASSSLGFIALDCATTPNGNRCPTATPPGPVDFAVHYDSATRKLSGWAWNDTIGWISFCGNAAGGSTLSGGRWICPANPIYQVTIDASPFNSFRGWAWNDVIGWISFSCDSTNTCSTVDYRVKTLENIAAPLAVLESSVIDTYLLTRSTSTINSIMWQGSLNGGEVGFQIASSNCPNGAIDPVEDPATNPVSCDSGGWDSGIICDEGMNSCFTGPNAGENDYNTSGYYYNAPPNVSSSNLPYQIKHNPEPAGSGNGHKNRRYLRYRIILRPSLTGVSPVVDDVILNFSR